MKGLKISKEKTLPLEATTQKLAWLGTTGSGKTYGASKMAEQMWYEGAQFVVLDPVGVWYGLRLAADGKSPSKLDIPILGGLHGDVPLQPTAGKLIADLIVDKNLSVVLDVSQFESDADKARFAGDFAGQFYFRKKAKPSAVHLFLEEVQEFVPQNPQRGEEKMLHNFVRMQKLGRNFGIGSSYISQRPQEVNKKALNMAQTLFVFRNTGTHERKAIELWIKDNSLDENIANDLPKIPTGECHIWSPEFLKISEMVHILQKDTFNASATPEVGKTTKAATLSAVDVAALKQDMADVIKESERDDPKTLRARIIQLETAKTPAPAALPVAMGVSQWLEYGKKNGYSTFFIDKAVQEAIKKRDKQWSFVIEQWKSLVFQLRRAISDVVKALPHPEKVEGELPESTPEAFEPVASQITQPIKPVRIGTEQEYPAVRTPTPNVSQSSSNQSLGSGERTILNCIAQYGGATTEHLAVLTGYKSTSRREYLRKLISKGLIARDGENHTATLEGMEALGSSFETLPTGPALRQHLLDTLPEGEKRLFRVLCDSYPSAVSGEDLMISTNYQATSVREYLRKLRARKLLDKDINKVTDNLF